MARTYKALSALLAYPSGELQAAVPDLRDAVRQEGMLAPALCAGLETLLGEIEAEDFVSLQERYVELFDRTRRISLNLFEHVHGESRDRGQAMVDLAGVYERKGMALAGSELPDHLPTFLEFLSVLPAAEARAMLADTVHILAALEERLAARQSSYAAVFAALRGLAGSHTHLAAPVDIPEAEAADLAALDAAWEESAVVFGPGEQLDGCSADRLTTRFRALSRDARRAAG